MIEIDHEDVILWIAFGVGVPWVWDDLQVTDVVKVDADVFDVDEHVDSFRWLCGGVCPRVVLKYEWDKLV